MNSKLTNERLNRRAIVHLRQSSPEQVFHNQESQRRQYGLADQARELGFRNVMVIDEDLGRTGSGLVERRKLDDLGEPKGETNAHRGALRYARRHGPIHKFYGAQSSISLVRVSFWLGCSSLLPSCLQCGLLLLGGRTNVFGIVGCKQSIKFVAGKFKSIQCVFPFWFKIKPDPV